MTEDTRVRCLIQANDLMFLADYLAAPRFAGLNGTRDMSKCDLIQVY
jgi:hypothetical protein